MKLIVSAINHQFFNAANFKSIYCNRDLHDGTGQIIIEYPDESAYPIYEGILYRTHAIYDAIMDGLVDADCQVIWIESMEAEIVSRIG